MNECVVVIPVHKSYYQLSLNEQKSIKRTIDVFSKEDIYLLLPENISVKEYELELSSRLKFKIISSHHFVDNFSYNKLLITNYFYNLFFDYKWMLICQVDTYIFYNNLEKFTKRDDYFFLGAPVLNSKFNDYHELTWVGNGGLSLRRIDRCFEVTGKLEYLNKVIPITKFSFLTGKSYFSSLSRKIIGFIAGFSFNKFLIRYLLRRDIHEDVFWCLWVPSIFSYLKPADIYTATRFSYEISPELLFSSIDKLPMGCHAWEKYNPSFWSKYI